MQQELAAHEATLEKEAEEERKKNDKAILALNTRKEALLKEKKTKAKQEISKLIQQGLYFYNPVDTQRCFNVQITFYGRYER